MITTSKPTLIKATNAPLAAVLHVSTDVESRVSVTVDDGTARWERRFYDYATQHALPLLGFKPNTTNQIVVTLTDRNRNEATVPKPLTFVTDPLPGGFPQISVLKSEPERMEPGYTLFRVGVHNELYWYIVIVDNSGQVVWYNTGPSTADVRQLPNGDLFMPWKTNFYEINMLGDVVKSWVVPTTLPIDLHDGVPTDHGTILYLSDALESVSGMPKSATDPYSPKATAKVLYEKVVEISAADGRVLKTWSPINVLDPRRFSYLYNIWEGGYDTEHANSVVEDPSDDSLIVSMRHQNAVIKFSRATGQLKWILGPHENWGPAWQPYLLKPVGTPFVWQYAQHSARLTPWGTLILYDNGNVRASPYAPRVQDNDNYSRAVEYRINEQTMEVSQVWDYGRTNVSERLYTGYEGSAQPLPQTGNILIDFPSVSYVNGAAPSQYGPAGVMVRIKEVTHDAAPEVVFDMAISMFNNTSNNYKDCTAYRCERIPDLYAHQPEPVEDLMVTDQDGTTGLEFSGDDTLSYAIQASTNLVDWTEIGAPSENEEKTGEFDFEDGQSGTHEARYYRVVVQ